MPFKVIIGAIIILFSGGAFAQQTEADSLENLIRSAPSDTNKIRLLNRLVTSLREKDNNRAISYAQQAIDLSKELEHKNGLALALENMAWILYRKGDYSRSLDLSTQALHVSGEIHDEMVAARSLINIAAIYYEQKQYQLAIDNFRKAYYAGKKLGDTLIMARGVNNIAFSFLGSQQFDSAMVYVHKGLELSTASDNHYMIAFSKRLLGDIYLGRKQLDKALASFHQCHELSLKHDNTFLKASVLHRLAKCYVQLEDYNRALGYLNENIPIAKQYGFKNELERSYKLCADIYFRKNDVRRAFQYQSAYISLHDSLHDQRNSEQLALMQIRFDSEMKQAQIELLTKDTALQAEEIQQQRIWIFFYVGCLSLLLILAFVLFYYNRHNRKAKIELKEKNREIQDQTRQLQNVNATKDKLFSIISHDLRSPVASLKALMELVSTRGLTQEEFVEVSHVLKKNLDSVYEDLDNLLLWAQTQLKGLQTYLEEIDLRKIADEKIKLFNDIAVGKGLTLLNEIPTEIKARADRNHVGLILRNLVANAIKFSLPGGTITLTALEQPEFIEVSVSDSGVGISVEDIDKLFNAETHFTRQGTNQEKGIGIGLLLTKEFVEINQGTIRVVSEPGKKTTFTFTLKPAKQPVLAG